MRMCWNRNGLFVFFGERKSELCVCVCFPLCVVRCLSCVFHDFFAWDVWLSLIGRSKNVVR